MNGHISGKEQYRTNTQDFRWDEERAEFDGHRTNIGEVQRMLSATAGVISLVSGLSRRNWAGVALAMVGGGLLYRAISGYCPAFGAVGIDTSSDYRRARPNDTSRLGRRKVRTDRATKMQRAIAINRPPNDLYQFWRSLDNLPRIMKHLDSVEVINDQMSHWVLKSMPGVPTIEWDAEIINDVKDQRIGWRSLQGADVNNTGSVEFKPTDDGKRTWLTVTLQYEPPAGQLGTAIAKWFGEDPDTKLAQDLQRFKEQMETNVFSQANTR
jgi:uncharacterized membrane protein